MKLNKQNVIIILADSARHYSTGGKDDRDKLEMMDRFKDESIYFTTAVTSAPSSIMSVSAMLTSLSSYYIASNYTDFLFDENKFLSLTKILMDQGYEVQSVQNARETRERFDTLLPHINKKFWPVGLKNSESNWSNKNINKILFNFISQRFSEKPLFLFLFYNVRHDPKTSDEVENGINILKKFDYWDNSIVFLGSDHGYMDPKRGYTPEGLQAMGLGHDLVMSDDNIRVPFYLRYPGFEPKVIDEPVSTLDIVPTILDLLNIKSECKLGVEMMGNSLLPLIQHEKSAVKYFNERMVRTDGRFFAQSARSTSIRNYKYKYVTRPEMSIEEFYDLENDKWEVNNLIAEKNLEDIINRFRKFYDESEKKAIEFQIDNITDKLKAKLITIAQNSIYNIVVYGFGENYYCSVIITALKKIYPVAEIFLLLDADKQNTVVFRSNNSSENKIYYNYDHELQNITIRDFNAKKKYDLGIILGEKNNLGIYEDIYMKLNDSLQCSVEVFVDINTNVGLSNSAGNFLKYLNKKKKYFIENPDALLRTINKVAIRLLKKLKLKKA